jgi:hypothetical protein
MSFRCPESSLLRHLTRGAWYRCVGGSRQWHNRGFASGQTIETDDLGFTIRWRGHGEVRARNLRTLSMPGRFASVLASGPSVRALRRPERIFDHFILEKPDLFRVVTRVARAVVLNPMSIFTAMLTVPDALEEASLFMREDLRRPFKRLQPTAAELADDPGLITNATGDIAFALDPSLGTFPAGTVVFDALQILFGIGCREVFMFGVDLTDGPRVAAGQERAGASLRAPDRARLRARRRVPAEDGAVARQRGGRVAPARHDHPQGRRQRTARPPGGSDGRGRGAVPARGVRSWRPCASSPASSDVVPAPTAAGCPG